MSEMWNRAAEETSAELEGSGRVVRTEPEHPGFWGWLKSKRHRLPIHPMTALLILACDWILFPGTVASFGLLTFFLSFLGLFLGFGATVFGQSYFAGESMGGKLALKGVIGALVVGVPFPVTGTLIGVATVVLARLAGLRPHRTLAAAASPAVSSRLASRRAAMPPTGVTTSGKTRQTEGAERAVGKRKEEADLERRRRIEGQIAAKERERNEVQRRYDDLYDDYLSDPPSPRVPGDEPAGLEMFRMQLDRLDREISDLRRLL